MRRIPACSMSLQHSLHGESVMYNVDPLASLADRAIFKMALASACKTYQCVSPLASSHGLGKPLGVPL